MGGRTVSARTGVSFADDAVLVPALRDGDDAAFAWLLDRYDQSLRRVAMSYVSSRAVADEVVQETWMGVINGIDRFEGRASLKTWVFRILMNIARSRGVREHRCIPFAAAAFALEDGAEPALDPDRFRPEGAEYAGHWMSYPAAWEHEPEDRLESSETLDVVRDAIRRLPPAQQEVITLRDVEGWTSSEICDALNISQTNQRVLLHRARSKVRAALERYFEGNTT
jgi:RNA polymerase sigma-70 factor (ECF subfamily)